ncbi:MAG TPA: alpha-2-macroglobulin family protein, partial [Gemmataceae bacterium]|nr:alpha-2-macroglobulin family protein [Gemmataceae bacterium]
VQARIEVSRTAGGPMPAALADVVAAIDGKTIHEQREAKFTAITDSTGPKTVLDVRFRLPPDLFEAAKAGAPPSATLSVTIRDGSDAEAIVRPIPLVTKTLNVEFFPEGGEMIEGVPGRVYVMVRTPAGKPADLKGTITDGTNTLAEMATLTDPENPGVNRGHGVFTITPKLGTKYYLKLSSPVGVNEPMKEGYPLPTAKGDGVSLTALDAVTPRDGAVRVRLVSPLGPKVLHVGAYARGRMIAHQKIELPANAPTEISLKGDDSAGGVTRVTVFEESIAKVAGRAPMLPRAERLVYRGSGEHLLLAATPDKPRYSPADKVRLDLSATNEKGTPTPAVLLVAVVNRSVITMADNKQDRLMPTHFLLSGDVKHPAELEHADFLLTDHPKAATALDLLLGTQGWRRFAEQDVAPANPQDRTEVDRMLVAHGQRTSAPVELFKLEEKRVASEFQPRLEQARLSVSRAESAWNDAITPLNLKVTAAERAVSAAVSAKWIAKESLDAYKERIEKYVPTLQNALVLALFACLVFVVFMAAMRADAKKKPSHVRPLVAVGGAVGVVAVVLLAMSTMGTNANSTFSFVGSSIKAPGGNEVSVARQDAFRPMGGGRGSSAGAGPPPGMAMPAGPLLPGVAPPAPKSLPVNPPNVEPGKKSPAGGSPPRWVSLPASGPRGNIAAVSMDGLLRDSNAMRPGLAIPDPTGGKRVDFAVTVDEIEKKIPTPSFVVREYAHQRDSALGEVRSDFTETVYWHPVLVLPSSGKASVSFQLSDDVARYQVLVAGHTTDGRIGAVTKTIEARKPFSLDPKLPLELSHTDAVDVAFRVTNDSDVRRNVSFTATATGLKSDAPLQHIFDLAPNAKDRKFLRLTPSVLKGDATVRVEGTSIPVAEKDVISRTIKIVPDGFPGVGSFSDTLTGKAKGSITLPKDVVPGSLKVRLEVYPTSLSDLLNGIDGMLREPCGCFEQTSSSNYPNTLILDYLNESKQAKPEVSGRAKEMLARGYARLTGFECPDTKLGTKWGFEWFGAADKQHEALTAYGLLQFKDMARVFAVDPALIKRTQDFLLSRRDGKGGFNVRGDGYHSWGAPKHIMAAYIVWALVESDPTDAERLDLKAEIAALKAMATDEDSAGGKDPYFVAMVANILLHRADRETAYKLLDRVQEKHTKDGAVTGATTSVTRSAGRDLDIQTTSLAMLGWMRAEDPKYHQTARACAKWISQQRGGYGGYGSTQSTVLALKALGLFATKFPRPAKSGEILVMANGKPAGVRPFGENDVEVIGLDIPDPETVFKPGERTEVEISTAAKQSYPFALSYSYSTLTPLSSEACAVRVSTKLAKAEATEGETVTLSVALE